MSKVRFWTGMYRVALAQNHRAPVTWICRNWCHHRLDTLDNRGVQSTEIRWWRGIAGGSVLFGHWFLHPSLLHRSNPFAKTIRRSTASGPRSQVIASRHLRTYYDSMILGKATVNTSMSLYRWERVTKSAIDWTLRLHDKERWTSGKIKSNCKFYVILTKKQIYSTV